MRREYVNSEAHCYKEREREREGSSFKFRSKTVYFGYVRCIIQKTKKEEVANRSPPFARRIKKMGEAVFLG